MKDNNNLFPHNIWTCGEYNENLKDYTKINCSSDITNQYSEIGESCMKIKKQDTGNFYIDARGTLGVGKTVMFTVNVNTKNAYNGAHKLCISLFNNEEWTDQYINIPSDFVGDVSLSMSIPSPTTTVIYRVLSNASGYVLSDDWRLISV